MKTLIGITAVLLVAFTAIFLANRGDRPDLGNVSGSYSENPGSFVDDDPVLGDPQAPVTLVEFGDYQCTFCTKFFKETEKPLIEKYVKTGKVKFVLRDFVVNGRESVNAAVGSLTGFIQQ